jgi:hypothetical protein
MIIIGLLIAGVLKGQELIGNARVTSTVAQIKAIDAATSTFRDTYQAVPGDMVTPNTRLPNCTALPCSNPGNGNGRIDSLPNAAPTAESTAYFPQLASANLITGIVPDAASTSWGGNFPESKIGASGFMPFSTTTPSTDLTGAVGTTGTNSGLFLALAPSVAAVAGTAVKPKDASRIDAKLDDGVPGTGDVVGVGSAGTAVTDCGSAGTNGVYATSGANATCAMYIHIQG